MNLLDLAKKFDETQDLDARIALAEQMRPLLGADYEEFDRRHEALVEEGRRLAQEPGPTDEEEDEQWAVLWHWRKDAVATPASTALRGMGFVPILDGQARGWQRGPVGFVEEIEITSDVPGAKLVSLYHGAWNLAPYDPSKQDGIPLPCRLSICTMFHAGIDTVYLIEARGQSGVARIRLHFGEDPVEGTLSGCTLGGGARNRVIVAARRLLRRNQHPSDRILAEQIFRDVGYSPKEPT